MGMVISPFSAAAAPPAGYGTHRYWRIFITANAGHASITGLAELEFRGSIGGPTLTGSGTPLAGGSGALEAGTTLAAAFNGANDSYGRTSPTNTWIGYDFGSAVTVAQVAFQARNTAPAYNTAPGSFTLDWSDDGSSWTTADTFTAVGHIPGGWLPFPEILATGYHRFWRLFCVDNNGGSTFVGIGEIEFRATPGGADQTVNVGISGTSNGRVIGSSIGAIGNEGYRAWDDNSGSWWAANAGTTNQWAAFIFPNPVTVTQAMLQAANSTSTNNNRQVKNGKIEWSNDGATWTTAATFTKTWAINEQILVTVTP